MLEKMDKARLNADYHEVLYRFTYNTKYKHDEVALKYEYIWKYIFILQQN